MIPGLMEIRLAIVRLDLHLRVSEPPQCAYLTPQALSGQVLFAEIFPPSPSPTPEPSLW